jgi:hypothetical protein
VAYHVPTDPAGTERDLTLCFLHFAFAKNTQSGPRGFRYHVRRLRLRDCQQSNRGRIPPGATACLRNSFSRPGYVLNQIHVLKVPLSSVAE